MGDRFGHLVKGLGHDLVALSAPSPTAADGSLGRGGQCVGGSGEGATHHRSGHSAEHGSFGGTQQGDCGESYVEAGRCTDGCQSGAQHFGCDPLEFLRNDGIARVDDAANSGTDGATDHSSNRTDQKPGAFVDPAVGGRRGLWPLRMEGHRVLRRCRCWFGHHGAGLSGPTLRTEEPWTGGLSLDEQRDLHTKECLITIPGWGTAAD